MDDLLIFVGLIILMCIYFCVKSYLVKQEEEKSEEIDDLFKYVKKQMNDEDIIIDALLDSSKNNGHENTDEDKHTIRMSFRKFAVVAYPYKKFVPECDHKSKYDGIKCTCGKPHAFDYHWDWPSQCKKSEKDGIPCTCGHHP
jgi:hypothetical protein